MKNFAMVLLVVPLFAFSQITKSGTFRLNDYVNLSTGAISSIPIPSERSQVVYPCTTSAINRDFFMNYFEHSLCICVCPSAAIGSPRPFYRSKKTFATMNLTVPLDLTDTALFTKIDTVRQSGGCALPYFVIDLYGSYNETFVYIVKTYNNTYALVRLSQIVNTVQCSDYDPNTGITDTWTQSRLNGFTVTWHLNSSGQPYFGWVPQAGVVSMPSKVTLLRNQNTLSSGAEVYSLLGRKIRAVLLGELNRPASGCPSVYIVKEGQSVRLMLK